MIAAEAPVLFAKACEMFILELTLRSWIHTEENKRRTLQRNDIAGAITRGDIFDFLVDIVPRDELKVSYKSLDPSRNIFDELCSYSIWDMLAFCVLVRVLDFSWTVHDISVFHDVLKTQNIFAILRCHMRCGVDPMRRGVAEFKIISGTTVRISITYSS